MAKSIKVIKCPQCGSTSKTLLDKDHYRCDSCQTEYYLDNDDINININNQVTPSPATPVAPAARKGIAVAIIIVVSLFVVNIIILPLFNRHRPSSPLTAKKEEEQYRNSNEEIGFFYSGTLKKPVFVMAASRDYDKLKNKNGFYFTFYDIKGKQLKEQRFAALPNSCYRSETGTLNNGDLYFITCNSLVYKIDRDAFLVSDAAPLLAKQQERLSSGIAKIDFGYRCYGDVFEVTANDGLSYSYYPLINKLFTVEERKKLENGYYTPLTGAGEKDYYSFSMHSSDYPEEQRQLLRIRFRYNEETPQDLFDYAEWRKETVNRHYTSHGITEITKKVLVSDDAIKRYRINGYRDLTPGRRYFEPEVVYATGKYLIIMFKPDANPNSAYKLQRIDPDNGAILWTLNEPDMNHGNPMVETPEGFIYMSDYRKYKYIDFDGKLLDTFDGRQL